MCDQSLFNYLRKILDRGPIQKKTFLSCGSCEGMFSLFLPIFLTFASNWDRRVIFFALTM